MISCHVLHYLFERLLLVLIEPGNDLFMFLPLQDSSALTRFRNDPVVPMDAGHRVMSVVGHIKSTETERTDRGPSTERRRSSIAQ